MQWFWIFDNFFEYFCDAYVWITSDSTDYEFSPELFYWVIKVLMWSVDYYHLMLACVCVCVYGHPPWRLHLSGTAGTAREQINHVVLKTLDSSAGSLHLYFGMKIITFQLAALSCSYTRSGHSHDLTSIRLAFRT